MESEWTEQRAYDITLLATDSDEAAERASNAVKFAKTPLEN